MSALFCCWIFCDAPAQKLAHQFVAAADIQLLGQHAQTAIGKDEVDRAYAVVAIQSVQQMLDEDRATGAGDGDRQCA